MAFSGIGKLISALTTQTSIADTDCFMVGTNDVKKITWANVITAIKAKLGGAATKSVANNLTTSTAGSSVLDAYQGKLLKQQLDEQNTNLQQLRRFSFKNYSGGTLTLNIPDGANMALIFCNHSNNAVEKAIFAYFFGANTTTALVTPMFVADSERITATVVSGGLQITHNIANTLNVEVLCFGNVNITGVNA